METEHLEDIQDSHQADLCNEAVKATCIPGRYCHRVTNLDGCVMDPHDDELQLPLSLQQYALKAQSHNHHHSICFVVSPCRCKRYSRLNRERWK